MVEAAYPPPRIDRNLEPCDKSFGWFQASLIQACHTGAASSLHTLMPATGTPSFLSRIIDVVSINSASLLPTIHMYTTCEGKLSWVLLDCPCLGHIGEAARSTAAVDTAATGTAAVGAQTTRWFGFHYTKQLINTVHRAGASFNLSRAGRAFRLAVTVVDQAIQGEGSVRFTQKECTMGNLPVRPLAEGVCKFHITDGVGSNVDKLYGETFVFDRLLRLVRRHFAFGTGHLIFRSIAQKFEQFAEEFRTKGRQCLESVARIEANGQPLAAARMREAAANTGAEAAAISRAGWNKWRKPLAPRADGTRKAVYQNKARATCFDNFGLTYWGLQARMQQSLESARVARVTQGKEITATTGLNTKDMKAWRSLGRAMLDIRVLVFNLGRVGYRKTSSRLCTRMSNIIEYEFVAGRCSVHLQHRDVGSRWRPRGNARYRADDATNLLGSGFRAAWQSWKFEESGHSQNGHHLVDNFENVACSSLLEILPQISGEVTRDPTWW